MTKKSADDLVGELAGIGEEIRQRATAEARKYIPLHIKELFLGGPNISRSQFGHRSTEDCIFEFLEEHPSLQAEPELKAALKQLDENGVSDDFRAGILFACTLFADLDFDY